LRIAVEHNPISSRRHPETDVQEKAPPLTPCAENPRSPFPPSGTRFRSMRPMCTAAPYPRLGPSSAAPCNRHPWRCLDPYVKATTCTSTPPCSDGRRERIGLHFSKQLNGPPVRWKMASCVTTCSENSDIRLQEGTDMVFDPSIHR
jgi:hypothetical protein